MTAMNLVVQERMLERRRSFDTHDTRRFRNLLDEVVQVLAGGFVRVAGPAPEVAAPLRRDLGLD